MGIGDMTLDDASLTTLARRMLSDYDRTEPGTAFAEGLRLTPPEGWRVQAAVAALREARGERVVGYKIGCIDLGNRQRMGLDHPACGRIWSSELYETGALLPRAKYANPAMEAEFAITLAGDFPSDEAVKDAGISLIEAIYPVIEIHNLVLHGDAPHGAQVLANNAINAGVVRGAAVAPPQIGQPTDLKLIFDGETVDEWDGLRWPADMLQGIDWLADQLAAQGLSLKQGDLILTGAFGPPLPIGPKGRVDVTSSAYGDVSATFA